MRILKSAALLAALCSTIATLSAQTPTPAQGRDYTGAIYRVLSVDSMGRLIVSPSGGSSGCPGTLLSPCIVEGLAANGAAIAGNPTQMGGSDGTLARYILVDTSGRIINVGAAADGAALAGNPLRIGISDGTSAQNAESASLIGDANAGAGLLAVASSLYNGSAFARQFSCNNPVAVSLSTSGTTQIAALSGVTRIRVCGVYLTAAAPVNLQLFRGTGTNCGTGTAALGGLYQITSTLALDFGNWSALTSNAGDALCLNLSSSVSVTGTVTIGQF